VHVPKDWAGFDEKQASGWKSSWKTVKEIFPGGGGFVVFDLRRGS
jgi:hypothetical protein